MITLLLLLNSLPTLAKPSAGVVEWVQESYSPALAVEEKEAWPSFLGCRNRDLVITAKDPVTRAPGALRARVYLPYFYRGQTESRSVIVLPPTGGENMIDRGYSNALCAAGFRVVLLQSWAHDTETELDLGMHDKGALRSLAAVRRVLDYLNPSRGDQVGILGTSVGAITSAFALGFDSRLNTGVLVVGGLGMAEIIGATTEQGAAKLREERKKFFRYPSQDDYLADLRQRLKIEPGDFVGFSGTKKVLAYVGLRDLTVPTKNQQDLVQAFGAESEDYEGDHLATIWHAYSHRLVHIVRFFQTNLR